MVITVFHEHIRQRPVVERKMGEDICEVCGYRSQLGAVGKHLIIPSEIMEQAGVSKSQISSICANCRIELERWYAVEVNRMVYDDMDQRFRDRTPVEMVKEYKSAFNGFKGYKKKTIKVL